MAQTETEAASAPGSDADHTKLRQIAWQSITGAFLISSIVAGAYPYIVLKLGYGPNASVVSAFLGAMFLNVTAFSMRGRNRLLNNIIQTAGTSAASTAFMCVVAAAFGYLEKNEAVDLHIHIGPWSMFLWLTCAGMLGVLFSVFFRVYFLSDPDMIFASGVAAAETIQVLDSHWDEARQKIRALGLAAVFSAAANALREGTSLLSPLYLAKPYRAGLEWTFLGIGSGILIGPYIGISMLLGTFVTAYVVGPWVISSGIGAEIVNAQILPAYLDTCQQLVPAPSPNAEQARFLTAHCGLLPNLQMQKYFPIVIAWTMWPATALMLAATLTTLALKWRSIANLFRTLRFDTSPASQDMGVRSILVLAVALTAVLSFVQYVYFDLSVLQTVVAIAASLPLMLVGIRVQGETNIGPVSAMANALQVVFAVIWPSQIGANLIAAGVAGTITAQGEGTIQDYKTGSILGSSPRLLTYVQLAAVPIGAAAVAIMYPILTSKYGLGGNGLSAPTGLKIANMAAILSEGVDALPRYALLTSVLACCAGVLIGIVRERSKARWVMLIPSVSGFGFALILPGELNIPMAMGGIGGWIWKKTAPGSFQRYAITVASGLIVGEAVVGGLILPILAAFGVHVK